MKRRVPSMVIVMAIHLLLPRAIHGAEALQIIRVGLPPKIARGYLDILRDERSLRTDLGPQKFVDFSMLPGAK